MHMMEVEAASNGGGDAVAAGGISESSISQRNVDPRATVVLIGFRGVSTEGSLRLAAVDVHAHTRFNVMRMKIGKSTLGLIIATHMGRSFIDADRALSRQAGCSPNEYVIKHSWEKFRWVASLITGCVPRSLC